MAVVACPLFGWLARRYTTARLRRGTFYGLVSGLFAAVVLTWAVSYARFPSDTTPLQLARFACLWGPAFALFLGLLEARHRRMPRAACWLGERSYPIYLLHPFVIVLIPKGWPAWAFVPCLVVSTLLLAALVHRLVEVPGIALGRRLEKHLRRAACPPPPRSNCGGRLERAVPGASFTVGHTPSSTGRCQSWSFLTSPP